MTSGQNISHYTTAKLLVHVWNHDLIWWQNKIDKQKHFRKTTITSFWTLSKTNIPITLVKAQMPSNPNQKSRMQDNKATTFCSDPMSGSHFIVRTNKFLLINATAVTLGQGHEKVIQYISPDLYILCPKYLRFSSNVFDVRGKSCCSRGRRGGRGGNKLKTWDSSQISLGGSLDVF